MNGSTSNPPSKYRADLLFWSTAIWGLRCLCRARAGSRGWACAELRAIVWRNEGAKVKEEAGNDAGDICLLLEPSPAHCGGAWQFWVTLSASTYLCPAPIWLAVAEDGGRRENRAAYWDNNVVYICDSCKPSATALKPFRATCELSLARPSHEWVNLPAQCAAFRAFKTLHLQ